MAPGPSWAQARAPWQVRSGDGHPSHVDRDDLADGRHPAELGHVGGLGVGRLGLLDAVVDPDVGPQAVLASRDDGRGHEAGDGGGDGGDGAGPAGEELVLLAVVDADVDELDEVLLHGVLLGIVGQDWARAVSSTGSSASTAVSWACTSRPARMPLSMA